MRRPPVGDIAVGIIILALAVFTLAPVVAHMRRTAPEAKCQANMHRIGEAIACYLEDNHSRYPTNRPLYGRAIQSIQWAVSLSPNPYSNGDGPQRFVYGLNWVEALYDYVDARAARTGQPREFCWRCPSASSAEHPTNYNGRRVTYAFNSCLAEQPRLIVRRSQNLMMLRETGYLTVSTLRPTNTAHPSTGNPSSLPVYPFLSEGRDTPLGYTSKQPKPHAGGSYILFADGHTRHFTIDYYPQNIVKQCWDPDAQQWYNFRYTNPTSDLQRKHDRSIAISP
jgi:prepilin-type processing-associated H-X9-DG protein